MNLQQLTFPNVGDILPLTEISTWLRVDDPTQQSVLTSLVKAAGSKFEEYTGRQILTSTWQMTRNAFPRYWRDGTSQTRHRWAIRIPKPPLQTLLSVQYYDANNSLQTLDPSAYQVSLDRIFGELWPAPGTYWPITTIGKANTVVIQFIAGYGSDRASVDEAIILGIKNLVGHWFENRESGDIPDFILNLWQQFDTGEELL